MWQICWIKEKCVRFNIQWKRKINKKNIIIFFCMKIFVILNDFSWTVKMFSVVFLCQDSYFSLTRNFLVFLFIFLRFISGSAKETNIAGQNKGKNNIKIKVYFFRLIFLYMGYAMSDERIYQKPFTKCHIYKMKSGNSFMS